jgi:fucose permease
MAATSGERRNVAILAANQALFLIAAITVMTLSGIVGQRLTPNPALATLPVAMMMIGVVVASLPASLLMKEVGRRAGFITGTLIGGAAGGVISVTAIGLESFVRPATRPHPRRPLRHHGRTLAGRWCTPSVAAHPQ